MGKDGKLTPIGGGYYKKKAEFMMLKLKKGSEEPKVKREKREPSTAMSFAVFLTAMAIMLLGIVVLGYDIHIVMLVVLAFACIASAALGYTFDDLVECMKKPLGQSMSAMIIFIFIGIIIAAWIYSGAVPALIYYGLKYITPQLFLPLGLILCSVMSLATGTSWGTIGTMGLAMMGIGAGLGIPAPITAGMVLCGAHFGDKMSPMSDTTNLAPAAAGTTLQNHINAMWKTTGPAYIIVLVIFLVIGMGYQDGTMDRTTIDLMSSTLESLFDMSPIVLLPVVVLLTLNVLQFPAIPGMAIGSLLAAIIACTVQGVPVVDMIAGLNYGYSASTGVELVDTLLNRGGIQSMMYTFSLACIAISFGGVMEQVGYLRGVINSFVPRIKSDRLMVPVVILVTTLCTITMGEVYLSLILGGSLFRETFQKRGLKPEMLSRLLEEGGTLTQVFVPWSTTSMFIVGAIGVTPAEYWPFAFLHWINPLLSIVLAMFGIFVLKEKTQTHAGNIQKE